MNLNIKNQRLFTMYHDTLNLDELNIYLLEIQFDELFDYLTKTCDFPVEKRT